MNLELIQVQVLQSISIVTFGLQAAAGGGTSGGRSGSGTNHIPLYRQLVVCQKKRKNNIFFEINTWPCKDGSQKKRHEQIIDKLVLHLAY